MDKKHNKSYFGYKNHVKAEAKIKFIVTYKVTDASVHDSQVYDQMLTTADKGEPFYVCANDWKGKSKDDNRVKQLGL